jgi:hypothetical protein
MNADVFDLVYKKKPKNARSDAFWHVSSKLLEDMRV